MRTLLVLSLLAGCTTGAVEKPIVTTTTVEVPVYLPCKLNVVRPQDLLTPLQVTDSVLTKVNAMLQELVLWRVYGDQVDAGQIACASSNSPVLPKSQ